MGALILYNYAVEEQKKKFGYSLACRSNLRDLTRALQMYCQDYDGVLPAPGIWTGGIWFYHKSPSATRCPNDTSTYGYAMNRSLPGRKCASFPDPGATVAFFESDLHRPNAEGSASDVVGRPRHHSGNWYSFLNGDVKRAVAPPLFTPIAAPRKVRGEGGHGP
jgi:hypothetical protein